MTNNLATPDVGAALDEVYGLHRRLASVRVFWCVLCVTSGLVFPCAAVSADSRAPLARAEKMIDLPDPPDAVLRLPSDVAIGKEGRAYVVDSGNSRVLAYDSDGGFLFAFGSALDAPARLVSPVGIGTSTDGQVLVADRGGRCIQVFNADGNHLKTIKTRAEDSDIAPVDVAINHEGERIYVTATEPYDGVLIFDKNGVPIGSWGRTGNDAGEFRYPATIEVGPQDQVYVVDVLNGRVQVFDPGGKYVMGIGSWGVSPGTFFRPKGVTVGPDGDLLVSDGYLGVIQLFDANARLRGVLGKGGEIARFDTPAGIALDEGNRLYVAEMLANRVSVWQLNY